MKVSGLLLGRYFSMCLLHLLAYGYVDALLNLNDHVEQPPLKIKPGQRACRSTWGSASAAVG